MAPIPLNVIDVTFGGKAANVNSYGGKTMDLTRIKKNLEAQNLYHSTTDLSGRPTVIGYEKKFRWKWMATQLNTFVIASDFNDAPITPGVMSDFIDEAFTLSKEHYAGWPRGIQSGLGVIAIALGTEITPDAQRYCTGLESGKKWAGFTVPTTVNTGSGAVYKFEKNPMWGRIYYPHFKALIEASLA